MRLGIVLWEIKTLFPPLLLTTGIHPQVQLNLSREEEGAKILEIAKNLAPYINKRRMLSGNDGIPPVDIAERIVGIVATTVQTNH